jgi:hypothetical protein
VEKCGTARQATDNNITRHMQFTCWINKATDTQSEYVILIDFSMATMDTRTRLNVKLIRTFPFMLTLNLVYRHDLKLLIVPSPWHTALDLHIFKLICISFKLILYVIFSQVKKWNRLVFRYERIFCPTHSCANIWTFPEREKFFCVVCVKHVWNLKWIIQALQGDTSDQWFTTAFI